MDESVKYSKHEPINVESDTSSATMPYDSSDSNSGDKDVFSNESLPDISCGISNSHSTNGRLFGMQNKRVEVVTLLDDDDISVHIPPSINSNCHKAEGVTHSSQQNRYVFNDETIAVSLAEDDVALLSADNLQKSSLSINKSSAYLENPPVLKKCRTPPKSLNSCIDISSSSDEEFELLSITEKIRKKYAGKLRGTARELLGCSPEHNTLLNPSTITKPYQFTQLIPPAKSDSKRNQQDLDYELPKLSDLIKDKKDIPFTENAASRLDVYEKSIANTDRKLQKEKKCLDKIERAKQKEEERQRKKKEKELAKALKDAEREAKQNTKPKDSVKLMQVIFDRNLMEHAGAGDLINVLQSSEINYTLGYQVLPHSITWQKDVVEHTVTEDLQVNRVIKETMESQLVILLPLPRFLEMVNTFVQNRKGIVTQNETILEQILKVQILFPSMNLTYVVIGLEQYFSDQKTKENSKFKARVRGTQETTSKKKSPKDTLPRVSRVDVEEVTIDAQLQGKVNFKFVANMAEVGNLIARFTKAIAEAPLKKMKQKQQGFSWYAEGDSSCAVKVDKEGNGLPQLWQQQICQFPGVGKEVSEAIASHYSSPQELLKAYKACRSSLEAEKLLQDIVVRRGIGPLATSRRVGPELSHKLHLFFTATDGNILLQRS